MVRLRFVLSEDEKEAVVDSVPGSFGRDWYPVPICIQERDQRMESREDRGDSLHRSEQVVQQ